MEEKETKKEVMEETKEEKTTKEKFEDNVVEKNTIDMKIYNVPKQYAIQFKKFADANGMRFNSAMILMLEKLDTMQKFESLETVIFKNRELIEKLYDELDLLKTPMAEQVQKEIKQIKKTYGSN